MFKRILIPVTSETLSQHVLQYGLEFAKAINASVVVTYALIAHDSSNLADELLESCARAALEHGVPCEKRLIDGFDTGIGDAISQLAKTADCDLILIGTHALEGFNRLVSGSVTEQVVHHVQIPVMVMRDQTEHYTPFKRILVPIDGGTASDGAQALAQSLASNLAAQLIFIHVIPNVPAPIADVTGVSSMIYDPVGQTKMLETQSEKILARAKQSDLTGTAIVKGVPAQFESVPVRILETATSEQADLIVIGTHGRVGLERLLLGSVAEAVTNHANVPVLLTHAEPKEVVAVQNQISGLMTT